MSTVVVAALYHFISLENREVLRERLFNLCQDNKIKGTLLLAHEGINGTVASSREGIDVLKNFLIAEGLFDGMEYKESFSDNMPFYRIKVRLKKEIVTLGVPQADPTVQVGQYLGPKEWDQLLQDPDVVLIDTRNDYEFQIGTFKNALNPGTQSFREFPEFVEKNLQNQTQKKIAMFCTGGIRCEKASSYMLMKGFENVYHLKGGILKYLEETPAEESSWEGECFVFDHRVSIKHGLELGEHKLCHGCRNPISPEEEESPFYERGVSCSKCYDITSLEHKNSARQRQHQIDIAKTQGLQHLGR
jgi:UPF0176 protein